MADRDRHCGPQHSHRIPQGSVIAIVCNIPPHFGSAQLRRYFTDLVDAAKVTTFHFKRRPETRLPDSVLTGVRTAHDGRHCCPVRLPASEAARFVERYHDRHWEDGEGVELEFKCWVHLCPESVGHTLDQLAEFRPPSYLPAGNVGTPSDQLLRLINECRLPTSVIKKLKLDLGSRRRRLYATVAFPYPRLIRGRVNPNVTSTCKPPRCLQQQSQKGHESPPKIQRDLEEKEGEEEEEEEEWDRHHELHQDVSARREVRSADDLELQQGTKERKFEEDMEVTWEKGGSGLVFYTDEQFWRKQDPEMNDSDEADDWDLDMQGYSEPGAGDRDARDLMAMLGYADTPAFSGVARNLMERQGWQQGQGLGARRSGRTSPVTVKMKQDRRGLGYGGAEADGDTTRVPLRRSQPRAAAGANPASFRISTVYDKESGGGHHES